MIAAGSTARGTWGWRPTPLTAFVLGALVVVEEGVLQGVRGEVLGVDGHGRVIVAISLQGQTSAVQLEPDWLRIECLPSRPALVH
jgi:hypothetical protein